MGVTRINRKSFMAEMRSLLAFMDAGERARVLRFYERMFDEAGEDGEAALLKKLGSPVRQVLLVERKYREKQEAEEAAAAEFAAEPVPAEEPTEKACAEETEEGSPENDFPEEEPPEDDFAVDVPAFADETAEDAAPALPEEDSDWEAEDIPYAGVISADTFAGDMPEPVMEEATGDGGADAAGAGAPSDTYDWEEQPDTAEEPEPAELPEEETPVGAGRVVAAVFVTIPMIVLVVLGISLSLLLGMIGLGPGVLFGAAGGYLAGYAIGSVTAFLPDMLLLAGGALLSFCLALFLLWLGVWLAVGGTRLTVRITAGVYRRILKKGDQAHE